MTVDRTDASDIREVTAAPGQRFVADDIVSTLVVPLGSLRVPGSNAERAGLRDGDQLIELDGVPAGQMNVGVFRAIGAKGKPVKVVVEREGERIELVVRP